MDIGLGSCVLVLAALGDDDLHLGLVVGSCLDILDLAQGQKSINQLAKHNVLVIQVLCFRGCDKELEKTKEYTRLDFPLWIINFRKHKSKG